MSQKNNKTHGIQITSNHSTNIYGDLVGGDKITTTTVSNIYSVDLSRWQEIMLSKIEKETFSTEKKKELKKTNQVN